MKKDWIKACLELSREPADFYSGARKILQNRTFIFTRMKDDLSLADSGYTKMKMRMLERLYFHEESHAAAIPLWERRIGQKKYGSVGFTTYNHFLKGDIEKKSKRASVMGPCIQSVCLTLNNKKTTDIDIFYRTTELYKKFPADLVFLRDVLLEPFDFSEAPIRQLNFHMANITCHPMYFVTIIPSLRNPLSTLESLRRKDEYFYNWVVKWTARYVCDEYSRGIMKFSQALRVRQDALDRVSNLPELQDYLRTNHPGYRNEYSDTDNNLGK